MGEEWKTFLMSKCIIGDIGGGVMQYLTHQAVFGDPYYDERIYFVVFAYPSLMNRISMVNVRVVGSSLQAGSS